MSNNMKAHQSERLTTRRPAPQRKARPSKRPNQQESLTAALQQQTIAPHSALTPAHILGLQRAIGNQAVSSLLREQDQQDVSPAPRPVIQAKLTIGQAGNKYEQEADSVAKQVMNTSITRGGCESLQRADEYDARGLDVSPEVEDSIRQARSGGRGLPEGLRARMEQAFGADFSGVSVHTGPQADRLNHSLQARAFTTGQNIFFRDGVYDPGSRAGQELIAHELTHVVQQTGGPPRAANFLTRRDPIGRRADSGPLAEDSLPASAPAAVVTARSSQADFGKVIQRVKASDIEPDRWKLEKDQPFRTKYRMVEQNAGVGEAEGYGADVTGGKKLKTKIVWADVDKNGKEGSRVTADVLGPDHPLGSAPGADKTQIWNLRTDAFNNIFEGSFKAGHLLNAKLGGPGNDARNLTAISGSANTNMLDKVESEIVKTVNSERKWIHYDVRVTYSQLTTQAVHPGNKNVTYDWYASAIDFTWGPVDSDGNKTGNTKTWQMTMGQPDINKVVKAGGNPVQETATGLATSQAETTLNWDDVILSEWTAVVQSLANIKDMTPFLDKLNKDLKDKDDEIKKLRQQVEDEKKEKEKAQQALKQIEDEKNQLKQQSDDQMVKYQEETDKYLQAQQELEQMRQKQAEMAEELRRYKLLKTKLNVAELNTPEKKRKLSPDDSTEYKKEFDDFSVMLEEVDSANDQLDLTLTDAQDVTPPTFASQSGNFLTNSNNNNNNNDNDLTLQ